MEVTPSRILMLAGFLLLLPLSISSPALSQTSPSAISPAAQTTNKATVSLPHRPPRVIADLRHFALDKTPRTIRRNDIGAGSRGSAQNLTLCAPATGVAYSDRPLFEWRSPDGRVEKVTFSLLNEAGDVLYENDVTGSSLAYPADAPALMAGQSYSWKVSGSAINRLPEPVAVQLQDKPARDALSAKLAADGAAADALDRAQIFLKESVWYDTVAVLRAAIKEAPDRMDLQEQLNRLYEQIAPACVAH